MVLDPRAVLKANEDASTTTFDETIMTYIRKKVTLKVRENSVIRGVYPTIKMPSATYNLPYQDVRMTVSSVAELADISAQKDAPEVKEKTQLVAKKLVAYTHISTEAIEDSIIGIIPFVIKEAVKEIGLAEENAFINGDSDGGGGAILEMWNGIYHLTNDNGSNNVTLTQTPITLSAMNEAMSKVETSDYELEDYVWLIHPKDVATLRGMDEFEHKDKFGSSSLAAGFQGKVYAIPVIKARKIPTTLGSGSNETIAILANKEYGVIGQKRTLRAYRFYQQTHDRLEIQWNERLAFAIEAGDYDSHALIKGIVA